MTLKGHSVALVGDFKSGFNLVYSDGRQESVSFGEGSITGPPIKQQDTVGVSSGGRSTGGGNGGRVESIINQSSPNSKSKTANKTNKMNENTNSRFNSSGGFKNSTGDQFNKLQQQARNQAGRQAELQAGQQSGQDLTALVKANQKNRLKNTRIKTMNNKTNQNKTANSPPKRRNTVNVDGSQTGNNAVVVHPSPSSMQSSQQGSDGKNGQEHSHPSQHHTTEQNTTLVSKTRKGGPTLVYESRGYYSYAGETKPYNGGETLKYSNNWKNLNTTTTGTPTLPLLAIRNDDVVTTAVLGGEKNSTTGDVVTDTTCHTSVGDYDDNDEAAALLEILPELYAHSDVNRHEVELLIMIKLVMKKAIGEEYSHGLRVFGSAVNGLRSKNSDLDLSWEMSSGVYRELALKRLHDLICDTEHLARRWYVELRPSRKSPILIIIDSISNIRCEVSVRNTPGVFNSEILRKYFVSPEGRTTTSTEATSTTSTHTSSITDQHDTKICRSLALLVKSWSKARLPSSAAGGLSSYCVVLMALFFLIQNKQIPSLERIMGEGLGILVETKKRKLLSKHETLQTSSGKKKKGVLQEVLSKKNPGKDEDANAIETFLEFVNFFLKFPTKTKAVCIRSTMEVQKSEVLKYPDTLGRTHSPHQIYVRDPLLNRNVAETCSSENEILFFIELKRAKQILEGRSEGKKSVLERAALGAKSEDLTSNKSLARKWSQLLYDEKPAIIHGADDEKPILYDPIQPPSPLSSEEFKSRVYGWFYDKKPDDSSDEKDKKASESKFSSEENVFTTKEPAAKTAQDLLDLDAYLSEQIKKKRLEEAERIEQRATRLEEIARKKQIMAVQQMPSIRKNSNNKQSDNDESLMETDQSTTCEEHASPPPADCIPLKSSDYLPTNSSESGTTVTENSSEDARKFPSAIPHKAPPLPPPGLTKNDVPNAWNNLNTKEHLVTHLRNNISPPPTQKPPAKPTQNTSQNNTALQENAKKNEITSILSRNASSSNDASKNVDGSKNNDASKNIDSSKSIDLKNLQHLNVSKATESLSRHKDGLWDHPFYHHFYPSTCEVAPGAFIDHVDHLITDSSDSDSRASSSDGALILKNIVEDTMIFKDSLKNNKDTKETKKKSLSPNKMGNKADKVAHKQGKLIDINDSTVAVIEKSMRALESQKALQKQRALDQWEAERQQKGKKGGKQKSSRRGKGGKDTQPSDSTKNKTSLAGSPILMVATSPLEGSPKAPMIAQPIYISKNGGFPNSENSQRKTLESKIIRKWTYEYNNLSDSQQSSGGAMIVDYNSMEHYNSMGTSMGTSSSTTSMGYTSSGEDYGVLGLSNASEAQCTSEPPDKYGYPRACTTEYYNGNNSTNGNAIYAYATNDYYANHFPVATSAAQAACTTALNHAATNSVEQKPSDYYYNTHAQSDNYKYSVQSNNKSIYYDPPPTQQITSSKTSSYTQNVFSKGRIQSAETSTIGKSSKEVSGSNSRSANDENRFLSATNLSRRQENSGSNSGCNGDLSSSNGGGNISSFRGIGDENSFVGSASTFGDVVNKTTYIASPHIRPSNNAHLMMPSPNNSGDEPEFELMLEEGSLEDQTDHFPSRHASHAFASHASHTSDHNSGGHHSASEHTISHPTAHHSAYDRSTYDSPPSRYSPPPHYKPPQEPRYSREYSKDSHLSKESQENSHTTQKGSRYEDSKYEESSDYADSKNKDSRHNHDAHGHHQYDAHSHQYSTSPPPSTYRAHPPPAYNSSMQPPAYSAHNNIGGTHVAYTTSPRYSPHSHGSVCNYSRHAATTYVATATAYDVRTGDPYEAHYVHAPPNHPLSPGLGSPHGYGGVGNRAPTHIAISTNSNPTTVYPTPNPDSRKPDSNYASPRPQEHFLKEFPPGLERFISPEVISPKLRGVKEVRRMSQTSTGAYVSVYPPPPLKTNNTVNHLGFLHDSLAIKHDKTLPLKCVGDLLCTVGVEINKVESEGRSNCYTVQNTVGLRRTKSEEEEIKVPPKIGDARAIRISPLGIQVTRRYCSSTEKENNYTMLPITTNKSEKIHVASEPPNDNSSQYYGSSQQPSNNSSQYPMSSEPSSTATTAIKTIKKTPLILEPGSIIHKEIYTPQFLPILEYTFKVSILKTYNSRIDIGLVPFHRNPQSSNIHSNVHSNIHSNVHSNVNSNHCSPHIVNHVSNHVSPHNSRDQCSPYKKSVCTPGKQTTSLPLGSNLPLLDVLKYSKDEYSKHEAYNAGMNQMIQGNSGPASFFLGLHPDHKFNGSCVFEDHVVEGSELIFYVNLSKGESYHRQYDVGNVVGTFGLRKGSKLMLKSDSLSDNNTVSSKGSKEKILEKDIHLFDLPSLPTATLPTTSTATPWSPGHGGHHHSYRNNVNKTLYMPCVMLLEKGDMVQVSW